LIGAKSNLPQVPTIEESSDPVLYTGRRLKSCFKIDIEEVVSINAVMLERKLKHVITRNLGGAVRLKEV